MTKTTDPVDIEALRDMGAALTADGHLFGARITAAADQVDRSMKWHEAALEEHAEVDRLRAVIENAPHDSLCNYGDSAVDFMGYPCTCWKADAL